MVHTTCAVGDCMSSSRIDKNLKFHQFPHTEERCKIWIEACGRPDLIGKTSDSLKHTHICSLHFGVHMYGKKSLKKTAIPVLFLPVKGTHSIGTQTDPMLSDVGLGFTQKRHKLKRKYPPKDHIVGPPSKISRVTEPKKSVCDSSNAKLTNHTSRKRRLRKELSKASNLKLSDEKYEDVMEKQFLAGCEKFLTPQLGAIVKAQLKERKEIK